MTRSWRTQSTTKASWVCNDLKGAKVHGLVNTSISIFGTSEGLCTILQGGGAPFCWGFSPKNFKDEVLQRTKWHDSAPCSASQWPVNKESLTFHCGSPSVIKGLQTCLTQGSVGIIVYGGDFIQYAQVGEEPEDMPGVRPRSHAAERGDRDGPRGESRGGYRGGSRHDTDGGRRGRWVEWPSHNYVKASVAIVKPWAETLLWQEAKWVIMKLMRKIRLRANANLTRWE